MGLGKYRPWLSATVCSIIDLGEDVVTIFDLGEQIVIYVTCVQHFGEQVEAVDVRLKAAGRVFNRRALVDLKSPVGGLGEKQLASHLVQKPDQMGWGMTNEG